MWIRCQKAEKAELKKTKNLIKITEIKNLLVNKDFRYRTNRSISMNSCVHKESL